MAISDKIQTVANSVTDIRAALKEINSDFGAGSITNLDDEIRSIGNGALVLYEDGEGNRRTKIVTNIRYIKSSVPGDIIAVMLPESYKSLWERSQFENTPIEWINLDNVEYIGAIVFGGCTNLKSVRLDKVKWIAGSAFSSSGLEGDIYLPRLLGFCYDTQASDPASSGEANQFSGCKSISRVMDLGSIPKINYGTFEGCTNLTEIHFPETMVNLAGNNIFTGDTKLSKVYYANLNHLFSVAYYSSSSTPFNASNASEREIYVGDTLVTNLTVPNGITSIQNYALYRCTSLTSVVMPNTVTSIGEAAFKQCVNLNSVTIPNSVTEIKADAFAECGFSSITIPNSVTTLGDRIFANCNNIVNLEIPSSVSSISLYTLCSPNSRHTIGANTGTLRIHCPIITASHTNGSTVKWNFKNVIAEDVTSTASGYCVFHSPDWIYASFNNIDTSNAFYYHGTGGASPLKFLEIRGTVSDNSNLFYSGNAYSINNLTLHLAYNGIAGQAAKFQLAGLWNKIYVGDGSSAAHDNAILAQYTADSGWGQYANKLDTWYNYVQSGGEYATPPTI